MVLVERPTEPLPLRSVGARRASLPAQARADDRIHPRIMMPVKVTLADERTSTWEVDEPTYRVFFWERGFGPPDVPRDQVGYGCET